ncbi:MAG: biopolymer transporter ExbD [Planctomycetota bacterium]|nr:biopolymer transporter ExbD [Planctomycetota bacterium]
MRFGRTIHEDTAEFDLTAMVDVVMLLVIFFAFTAQFTRTLATPVDLPREQGAREAAGAAPKALVIDITRDGSFLVMGQRADPEWLVQSVARDVRAAGGGQNLDVIVRADRAASAAHLNTLAGVLSRAGVRTWRLATSAEEGPRP